MLYNIYKKRKQKILIYLAYNKQVPQPMPVIEQNYYEKLLVIINSEKLNLEETDNKNLLALQSIPKIILPSGNEIGPLEKDQFIFAENEEDKKFLINNNICKII